MRGRGIAARVLSYGTSLARLAEVVWCLLLLVVLPTKLLEEGGIVCGRLSGPRARAAACLLKLVLGNLEHLLEVLETLLQSLGPARHSASI